MKMFTTQVSMIEAGKISIFQLRQLMGYVDRKPHKYYEGALEAIEYYKPKLTPHDTGNVNDLLRRTLMSRDSVEKKGVTQEQRDQFSMVSAVFVSSIKKQSLGDFVIHIPLYQIEYGSGELGFQFYISANKPVFI